jgi:hypothetical protein
MSVLVKLNGGLGNQLFQFAAARILANKLDQNLLIDTYYLNDGNINKTRRLYSLDLFDLNNPVINSNHWNRYFNKLTYAIQKAATRKLELAEINWQETSYYRQFSSIVLNGYFQQLDYLEANKAYLQEVLRFNPAIKKQHELDLAEIESQQSVSIHIRRGDYLTAKNQEIYHSCDLTYYIKAIEYIQTLYPNSVFHIFSDDPGWAIENLKPATNDLRYENYGQNDRSDFYLMSNCRHHIIANSTFSWWAAFLNGKQHKTVIAPNKWYKDAAANQAALQLLPINWVQL